MIARMLEQLERVARRLNEDPNEKLEGVNQFELRDSGDDRAYFLAQIDGEVKFLPGRHSAPDVTVTLTEAAVNLISGGADLQDPAVLSDLEVSGDPSKIFPVYLLEDDAPAWLEWAAEVSRRDCPIPTSIERVDPTQSAVEAAIAKGAPFVIRAPAGAAPKWTLDYIDKSFGDLPASVVAGTRTVRESLDRIRGGKTVDGAYRAPEAMVADVGVPTFLANKLDGRPKLFLAPPGGVTPAHRDNSPGLAWHLIGRKRWLFLPPSYADRVYIRATEPNAQLAGVDFNAPLDGDRPPLFRDVVPAEVVVHPGESVYIPALWFHQVHQEDLTVSMSYFVVNDSAAN